MEGRWGGGVGGEGGGTRFMYCRSRITINSRPFESLLCRDGARRAFRDRGGHRMHQARSALRCLASRMKGELHPTKKHL